MTKSTQELLQLARRLVSLLEEPEPGLFTWNEAVRDLTDTMYFATRGPEDNDE